MAENIVNIPPFKMAGNIYFVGEYRASSHLVATDEGLILIDAGYKETADVIISGIEKLGFDIKDLKYIILSHEHFDHTGGAKKLLDSAPDAKTIIGEKALYFSKMYIHPLNMYFPKDCIFTPDIVIKDGDKLKLCGIDFDFYETPGHCPGVISFFFDVEIEGEKYRAGTFGGTGIKQISKPELIRRGLPYSLRGDFYTSTMRMKEQEVDIFLANHAWQNNTWERYLESLETDKNPFIDKSIWEDFMEITEASFYDLIEKESREYFVNYAHRGASEYAPENTLMSFYMGMQMGANGIETDVQRTKDGVLVLFHDDTIERMTGKKDRICDYTYEELRGMDVSLGGIYDKIVALEDFLKLFSFRDISFAIELKVDNIEKDTIDLLRKYNMIDKTLISSFCLDRLRKAKEYAPDFRIGYLTEMVDETVESELKNIGADELCPHAKLINTKTVDSWHKMGFRVRAWGVSSEEIMKNVYDSGADGMTVNFPDKLTEYIKSK